MESHKRSRHQCSMCPLLEDKIVKATRTETYAELVKTTVLNLDTLMTCFQHWKGHGVYITYNPHHIVIDMDHNKTEEDMLDEEHRLDFITRDEELAPLPSVKHNIPKADHAKWVDATNECQKCLRLTQVPECVEGKKKNQYELKCTLDGFFCEDLNKLIHALDIKEIALWADKSCLLLHVELN